MFTERLADSGANTLPEAQTLTQSKMALSMTRRTSIHQTQPTLMKVNANRKSHILTHLLKQVTQITLAVFYKVKNSNREAIVKMG